MRFTETIKENALLGPLIHNVDKPKRNLEEFYDLLNEFPSITDEYLK